jgi:hypothetical protein
MSNRSILLLTTFCVALGSAVALDQAAAHSDGGGGGGGGGGGNGSSFHTGGGGSGGGAGNFHSLGSEMHSAPVSSAIKSISSPAPVHMLAGSVAGSISGSYGTKQYGQKMWPSAAKVLLPPIVSKEPVPQLTPKFNPGVQKTTAIPASALPSIPGPCRHRR